MVMPPRRDHRPVLVDRAGVAARGARKAVPVAERRVAAADLAASAARADPVAAVARASQ